MKSVATGPVSAAWWSQPGGSLGAVEDAAGDADDFAGFGFLASPEADALAEPAGLVDLEVLGALADPDSLGSPAFGSPALGSAFFGSLASVGDAGALRTSQAPGTWALRARAIR